MSDFYIIPNVDNEARYQNIDKTVRALDKSQKWHVSVKLFKAKRSIYQNNYYWGPMLGTIKAWYHDTRGKAVDEEALHEEFKKIYCPYKEKAGLEGVAKVYKSTTALTKAEFVEMTDRIISDFAEMGCYIPSPDKNWKDSHV